MLFKMLKKIGVLLTFIGWIKMVYTDVSNRVLVHKFLTTLIMMELDVWQAARSH